MRIRTFARRARLALASTLAACLFVGPFGCDGGSGTETGKTGELPPEAKQSNKNMEDFMKTPKKP
jgi:hypothetical protein